MNQHIIRRVLGLGIMAASLLTACSDKEVSGTPPTPVPTRSQSLQLQFGMGSIAPELVDSVVVTLDGQSTPGKQIFKLGQQGTLFSKDLAGLPAGSWKMTVTVHARSNEAGPSRQFVFDQEINTPLTSNFAMRAPDGRIGSFWKPRAVFQDASTGTTAILPMDPADPYFEISTRTGLARSMQLERQLQDRINGTLETISSKTVQKQFQEGIMGHADYISFQPFASAANGLEWKRFESLITINLADGKAIRFIHVQER